MRLFSYQDKNKQKRVGLLRAPDAKEFIDLGATDAALPKSLLEIIETAGAMDRVSQLAKAPNAVIQPLVGVNFIPLSISQAKLFAWV